MNHVIALPHMNELAVCRTFIIARVTLHHLQKTLRSLLIISSPRLQMANLIYVFQWLNTKVILPALLQFSHKNTYENLLVYL